MHKIQKRRITSHILWFQTLSNIDFITKVVCYWQTSLYDELAECSQTLPHTYLTAIKSNYAAYSKYWNERKRLRSFENRVVRRIFWAKRREETQGWRTQGRSKNGGACNTSERKNVYKIFEGKSDRKKILRNIKCKLEQTINMDLKKKWVGECVCLCVDSLIWYRIMSGHSLSWTR
jgi:hypothetical protein